MTAISIAPLRKKRPNDEVYTRLQEIEAKLAEITALRRDQIAARCDVRDKESAEYIPSECLVYLVREHRSKPLDACAEVLFKTLMERVLAGLPKAETSDGKHESLRHSNIRDEGRYRFIKMLAMDRQDYLEALDFCQRALKTGQGGADENRPL